MSKGRKKNNTSYWGDNSQCKKCLYRLHFSNEQVLCGFMYYTGKRRPCEPSPNCTAFEKYTKQGRLKIEDKWQKLGGF